MAFAGHPVWLSKKTAIILKLWCRKYSGPHFPTLRRMEFLWTYRGRNENCFSPPAQIRTGPIKAFGSYLGCLAAKRAAGQG